VFCYAFRRRAWVHDGEIFLHLNRCFKGGRKPGTGAYMSEDVRRFSATEGRPMSGAAGQRDKEDRTYRSTGNSLHRQIQRPTLLQHDRHIVQGSRAEI
jgi:hypothetical protein